MEIRSKEGLLHFQRWRFIDLPWFGVYIHRILQSDDDFHLHNHPWNYFSVVLDGDGLEINEEWVPENLNPGFYTFHKRSRYHQIEVHNPLTTFFVRGKKYWSDKKEGISNWGYCVDGEFVHHLRYREMKREQLFDSPDNIFLLEGYDDEVEDDSLE